MNSDSTAPPPPPPPPEEVPARKSKPTRRIPRVPLRLAVRKTVAASVVVAALLFAGLTLQMARGDDPGLGSRQTTSPSRDVSPLSVLNEDDYGDDDGDDDDGDDEGGASVTQQVPLPTPVQTQTS